jgi:hypothetical protein
MHEKNPRPVAFLNAASEYVKRNNREINYQYAH